MRVTISDVQAWRVRFLTRLDAPMLAEQLFAPMPDVVFCLKDLDARYVSVNQAFLDRVGLARTDQVLGCRAADIFPAELARGYDAQDQDVLSTGRELHGQLELITEPGGRLGWYVADKVPLHDRDGTRCGLASVSRDLHAPSERAVRLAELAEAVDHLRTHFDQPVRIADVAELAGLSMKQFERRMHKVFSLSARSFLQKLRLEAATDLLLRTDLSVGEITGRCGYPDQSAFTRQFRQTVGLTPTEYRRLYRPITGG